MKKLLFFSLSLFGFSSLQAQYCAPALDCTDNDVILNVQFAGINNTSTCSTNGYGDFTTTVAAAEVEAGEIYPIAVRVGSGWTYETVGVWIDFDSSNTFDADEFIEIGTGSGSVVSGVIEIPETVLDGTYRMRVNVYASDLANDDPCYNELFDYGEFEDYLVTVTNLATIDLNSAKASLYPNPVADEFKINLNSKFNQTAVKVTVTDVTGRSVKTFDVADSYNVADLAKGVYIVTITDGVNKITQKLIKK